MIGVWDYESKLVACQQMFHVMEIEDEETNVVEEEQYDRET